MLSDNEHRTQHWVQLIAIANSSGANDAKIARLEKQVEELQSALHRSRSPRMRPRQRALPQSKMLALSAPASSSSQPMVLTASQNKRKQRAGRGKGSKGERFQRKEFWQRKGSDELREDHGHTGSEPGFCHVSSCAQRDVLQVSEGDVHGRFSLPGGSIHVSFVAQRETIQLLPLSPIEAQLISSLRNS